MSTKQEFKGITTSNYEDNTLSIYADDLLTKSIILKNTGDTNSLGFKITGYMDRYSKISHSIKPEDILKKGDTYLCRINEPFAKIVISLKNVSENSPTTYAIETNLN